MVRLLSLLLVPLLGCPSTAPPADDDDAVDDDDLADDEIISFTSSESGVWYVEVELVSDSGDLGNPYEALLEIN